MIAYIFQHSHPINRSEIPDKTEKPINIREFERRSSIFKMIVLTVALLLLNQANLNNVNCQLFGGLIPTPKIPGLSSLFGDNGQGNSNSNTIGGRINVPGSGSVGGDVTMPASNSMTKTFETLSGNFSQQINNQINNMLGNIQTMFSNTPIAPFVNAGISMAQSALQQTSSVGRNLFGAQNPISSFIQGIISQGQNFFSSLPGISTLFNASRLSGFSNSGIPQIPGLPEIPQIPGIPEIPQIPGLPKIPQIPGIPDFFNITSSFPSVPDLSNIPGLSNIPNFTPNIPGLPNLQIPGVSNISSVFSSIPNFADVAKSFPIPDSLQQPFQTALDQLGSVANLSALQSISQIQGSLGNLQNISQVYVSGINQLADNGIQTINNSLNNLSEDVRKCVNESGVTPFTTIDVARNESIKCVLDKIQEAVDIAEKSVQNIKNTFQGAQNVTSAIQECGQYSMNVSTTAAPIFEAAKVSCYGAALLSVNSDAFVLPIEIAQRAAEADSFIQSFRGYALKCTAKVGQKVAQQIFETGRITAKCLIQNSS